MSGAAGAYVSPEERRRESQRGGNYEAISPFLQHSQEAEN